MLIKVDYRDAELYNRCCTIVSNNVDKYNNIKIEKETIPLGDIIIYDDNGREKTIIERKTLADLASSIRDGRYAEQSFRLNQCSLHNHNIFYVIEGDLRTYKPFKGNVDKKALLSSMVSISYFKGFSIFRTVNMDETAEWIVQFAYKLNKEGIDAKPFYNIIYSTFSNNDKLSDITDTNINTSNDNTSNNNTSNDNTSNDNTSTHITDKNTNMKIDGNNSSDIVDNKTSNIQYSDVCSRVKKNNVTPENIDVIMLSQIPNISSVTANAIIEKFGSIKLLIDAIKNDTTILDSILIKNKNGQSRKLNKNSINNIYNYLLHDTVLEK